MDIKTELRGNCALCYKSLDRFSVNSIIIDDFYIEILIFLIPKLDVNTLKDSRICDKCLMKIYEAHNFKTAYSVNSKEDSNVKIKNEVCGNNLVCYVCKNVVKEASCESFKKFITKNDIKDAVDHLILNLSVYTTQEQKICTNCQNTLLNITNIVTLLSIYKKREQLTEVKKDKYSTPSSNKINIKCEETTELANSDTLNSFKSCDIKIKQEINDLDQSYSEEPEVYKGSSYDDFICKNEEIDLKIEVDEDNIEENVTTTAEREDSTPNDQLDSNSVKPLENIKRPDKTVLHKCPSCEYKTRNKYCLTKHLVVHKSDEEINWYKCTECQFQTKHKQSFVSHKLVHKSPNEIEMFLCDYCDYRTKFKANIRRHVVLHIDYDQSELFKCSDCSYTSKFKHQVEHHRIIHKSPEEIKWFSCPQCPFKTKRNCDLTRHKITHKNPNQMDMYQCQFCEFRTKFKYNLKPHMLVHKKPNEIQWYKCSECSYQFKRKYTLEQHMLIHRKPDEIELFKCQYCDFQTKRKYNLSGHMLNHYDLINGIKT